MFLNNHLPNGFAGNQLFRARRLYLRTDNAPDMSPLIHWLRADSPVDSCTGQWSFSGHEIAGFEQATPSQLVRGRWIVGGGSKVTAAWADALTGKERWRQVGQDVHVINGLEEVACYSG